MRTLRKTKGKIVPTEIKTMRLKLLKWETFLSNEKRV